MKTIQYLTLALLMLLTVSLQAQDKNDIIITNDGKVIQGQVLKVQEENVVFTYPGEAIENTMSKSNISKIVFKNGREQTFSQGAKAAQPPAEAVGAARGTENAAGEKPTFKVEQNMMAVLPLMFVNQETGELSEQNSKNAQHMIHEFYEKHSTNIRPLALQDTRTTNSRLREAGVNYNNLDEYSIEDLQRALGVEYIVFGEVTYTTGQSNISSTYGNVDQKKKSDNKSDTKVSGSTYSTERTKFDYKVVVEIYKNKDKIYSKSREPFGDTDDSWQSAFEYLLKRTPIYQK
ncbi:hypothetical protein V6R21_23600 [Limibacter armeniacum]|uniref:hypothetical protein n=1 Tax=Limibacter armeniacum TaxID=466084 RepID=UPI002FE624E9